MHTIMQRKNYCKVAWCPQSCIPTCEMQELFTVGQAWWGDFTTLFIILFWNVVTPLWQLTASFKYPRRVWLCWTYLRFWSQNDIRCDHKSFFPHSRHGSLSFLATFYRQMREAPCACLHTVFWVIHGNVTSSAGCYKRYEECRDLQTVRLLHLSCRLQYERIWEWVCVCVCWPCRAIVHTHFCFCYLPEGVRVNT